MPEPKLLPGILVTLLFTASAHAQLLEEHFSYANGNLGASGSGSAVWTGGDSPATALTVNSSAALSGNLFGAAGSGVAYNGGTFKKKAAPFAAQSGAGTTVYVSFLINIQTAPSTVKPLLYLQNGNSASSSPPLGIFLNGTSQLGLAKFASSPAVTSASLGAGTHVVVACYSFLAGNDQVDLWVDPTSLGTNAVPVATLTTGTSSSSDAASLSYAATGYENADGFACKLYAGRGNKFTGCRAWENCDDGWDLFQTEYEIVIERCWSWHNGDPSVFGLVSFNGDGNCFKLGGDDTYCPVTVIQCVALNAQWGTTVGFAFNNNTAPATLLNCSALHCGRPYKFAQTGNLFKNCLDWSSTRPAPVDITGSSTFANNSWNLAVTASARRQPAEQ